MFPLLVNHIQLYIPINVIDGYAKTHIDIDKFMTGFCKWHLDNIIVPIGNFNTIVATTDKDWAGRSGYRDARLLLEHQINGVSIQKCGYKVDFFDCFNGSGSYDFLPIMINYDTKELRYAVLPLDLMVTASAVQRP
jgi:hypothetical protein